MKCNISKLVVITGKYFAEKIVSPTCSPMKTAVLFFALILSLHSFSQQQKKLGKEFHVSPKEDKGNHVRDGSADWPFRTIMEAANVALPGDVITVHAGVYRESIVPPRGGDSDEKRITYQAAPGEKVEIKGSEIVKGWGKVNNDTWMVKLPDTFFGKFNPFEELIKGDWFFPTPKDRKYHTGAVYLNGDWMMEASALDTVMTAQIKTPLWFAKTDSAATTIWAHFKNKNPNNETVEINVRQTIFYPDKPFMNYITVRGFIMQHAATNWAPPTAEQRGLIGTHWSKGWIIENNTILYSKCVGIALGKYGDEYDNKNTESAEGYVGTINRGLAFGWNKSSIGGHMVRKNHIAYCEQAGVVGSLGCSFSTVEGNEIHDIHVRKLFSGYEMAAIKFHGAIDVVISNNHIYNTCMGVWMDWMAQGTQISNNLLHDNGTDMYLEVDHGPLLLYNNIILSKTALYINAQGAAFVHNLFAGKINARFFDSRVTPYHLPHSTETAKFYGNPSGDIQFRNNIFVAGGNVEQYYRAMLPVIFTGNVFTKGSTRPVNNGTKKELGYWDNEAKAKINELKEQPATETHTLEKTDFDAGVKLITEKNGVYLEINTDADWKKEHKRDIVSTAILGKAIIPNLPFENPDGMPVTIDTDYFGRKRSTNPSPGPIEWKNGKQRIKVWE